MCDIMLPNQHIIPVKQLFLVSKNTAITLSSKYVYDLESGQMIGHLKASTI